MAAVNWFKFGTGLSVLSSFMGGIGAKNALDARASLMDYNAKLIEAGATRDAEEARMRKRLVISRARAVAGASGLAVDGDPGYVQLESLLEAEGELQAMSALWAGAQQAASKRYEADITRAEGKATRTAGFLSAAGTAITGYGIYKSEFDEDSINTEALRRVSRSS